MSGRKALQSAVKPPLGICDVSPRPFFLSNIVIFSNRQYVKDFLCDEDFQYVGCGLGRQAFLQPLVCVGGSVRAANGPECEGLGLLG